MSSISPQQAIQAIKSKPLAPIYVVQGSEYFLQQQVRQAFLSAVQVTHDDLNFAQFDLEKDTLDNVLDEAVTIPFFGEQRLVFAEHPLFLTSEKKANQPEQNIERLLDYCVEPASSTVLVFFAPYDKLDERKKVTKQLKKNATVIDVQPLKEAEVRRYLQQTLDNENVQMDRQAFDLFVQLTDCQLSKAMQELDKLCLYAGDGGIITKDVVMALIPKTLEHNVFELTNDVLQGNVQQALQLYQDLLLQGEETIKVNAILLSQIRLLLQTSMLMKIGYQQGNIAETLSIHPYRVKLAMQQARHFQVKQLAQIYDQLVENDYLIKSGQMDKEFLFQLFVLQMAQKRK